MSYLKIFGDAAVVWFSTTTTGKLEIQAISVVLCYKNKEWLKAN